MELRDFLSALTVPSTGLSALIAWWLIDRVKVRLWRYEPARPGKAGLRWLALVLSAFIAILAYLGLVGMAYVAAPVDTRAWIGALFSVGAGAFGASQLLQGHMSDRAKAGK